MSDIDADFLPTDLPARRYGVTSTVVVQTSDSWDESRDLLATAASPAGERAGVRGVVAWADLFASDLAEQLAALRGGHGGDHLVGVRTQVQAEAEGYLDRPDVRRGIATVGSAGLAFDLIVRADQLASAARLAHDLPDVPLVLDHLGKPDLAGTDRLAAWRTDLAALASAPHVTAKLSGLVTEARWKTWSVDDLRPAVGHALDVFGPDRLMFGSDWPVCLLATDYARWLAVVDELLDPLDAVQRSAVWAGTARRVYGSALNRPSEEASP